MSVAKALRDRIGSRNFPPRSRIFCDIHVTFIFRSSFTHSSGSCYDRPTVINIGILTTLALLINNNLELLNLPNRRQM